MSTPTHSIRACLDTGCPHLGVSYPPSEAGRSLARLVCRHPCYRGGAAMLAVVPTQIRLEDVPVEGCPLKAPDSVAALLAEVTERPEMWAGEELPRITDGSQRPPELSSEEEGESWKA